MWVQEGGDCKDADEDTVRSNSWFSRFYRPKKKQTITTIGIPMRKPKPIEPTKKAVDIKSPQKIEPEEKEKEASESPKTNSVPMSPAQFLQNIEKSKVDDKADDVDKTYNPVPFTINNIVQNLINGSDHEQDAEHNADPIDDDDHHIDDAEDDGKEIDLTIIGKKLEMLDSIPSDFNVDDQDLDIVMKDYTETHQEDTEISEQTKEDQDVEEEDDAEDVEAEPYTGFDDESNKAYIDNVAFNGLDVKTWKEWDECMDFTQKNGLLVIELYSTMFGPSNVMYSMIADILQKKQRKKVRFVRLNIRRFSQIDEIKEVITDYRCYTASPIPMYIFIKNGVKVDKLQGVQLREFEKLIDKYTQHQTERPQSAQQTIETKKYRSILSERPQSAYLPSKAPLDVDAVDKENESQRGNVENIRNLIKNLDVSPTSQGTKLSKFSTGKSSDICTQQIL